MVSRAARLDHCVIAVSDWETSNAFYRDVVGAEILDVGAGRFAYRVGDTQLNVHGPGVDVGSLVGRLPVQPGNSDLCLVWEGPIGEAVAHLETQGVEVESGPMDDLRRRRSRNQRLLPRPGRQPARVHLVWLGSVF